MLKREMLSSGEEKVKEGEHEEVVAFSPLHTRLQDSSLLILFLI